MLKAIIVRADGQRVRMTLRHGTSAMALYHIAEVFPRFQSVQLTFVRTQKVGATC